MNEEKYIVLFDVIDWESKRIRALRRHHRKRIIRKRYEKVKAGRWYVKNPGYLAKNNTVCSCWMCGNPRKYFGELTRQEKISKWGTLPLFHNS